MFKKIDFYFSPMPASSKIACTVGISSRLELCCCLPQIMRLCILPTLRHRSFMHVLSIGLCSIMGSPTSFVPTLINTSYYIFFKFIPGLFSSTSDIPKDSGYYPALSTGYRHWCFSLFLLFARPS